MAASVKREHKPHTAAPRLTPRPTAASTARAARNATKQILSQTSTKSPSRSSLKKPAAVTEVKSAGTQKQENESETPSQVTSLPSEKTLSDIVDTENEEVDAETITIAELAESLDVSASENVSMISEEPPTLPSIERKVNPQTTQRSRPQTPTRSRPNTPRSRPTTPKPSTQSNRPQTPRDSKPGTPSTPMRQNTPNKAQNFQLQRRGSSIKQPASINRNVPGDLTSKASKCSTNVEEDLKSMYDSKQNEFLQMKRELDFKQQAVLTMFENLRSLSDQLAQEGKIGSGEGFQVKELVMFNVGDWTSEEVAQLCRDASGSGSSDLALEVISSANPADDHVLEELDNKITKLPTCFAELCLQAFTARQELIDWVKQLLANVDKDCNESIDRIALYNQQGLELCEALRDLKTRSDDAVDAIMQFSRRTYRERSKLISVGESLVREISRLRQEFKKQSQEKVTTSSEDASKAVEEARKELETEKQARVAMSKKLVLVESQLRQSQSRVTKMDRQLREAEASIASLTGTVKSLEDQSRQREVQLEIRARKLKESLKTSELSSNQLIQQRDLLQEEVQNLKEYMENMQNQNKATIQELKKEIKDLTSALEEQRKETEKQVTLKNSVEEKLKTRDQQLSELKNKNRELELSKASPELPTEREMDLWAELQATKDTLRMTEEEVTQYKRDKVRFLESITKIAETDNKVEMQQKLAAELLSKEEIISKMQAQMREVAKQVKLNEQKVMQYEQYIQNLQAHNRSLISQGTENNQGLSFQELQKEILSLRMSLLDSNHRNEELSELLAQKEQQLEQQDKTSRTQARVIKVREELINMLKNKEAEQSQEMVAMQQDLEQRMKIVEEVNKQIASKAEEIQELFTTLENKQQQIHRLEKIVLALEEQQRRTQAQRTRYEEKIAALEHELAASKVRERKFLFF